MIFLSKGVIFRFHVNFLGGIYFQISAIKNGGYVITRLTHISC